MLPDRSALLRHCADTGHLIPRNSAPSARQLTEQWQMPPNCHCLRHRQFFRPVHRCRLPKCRRLRTQSVPEVQGPFAGQVWLVGHPPQPASRLLRGFDMNSAEQLSDARARALRTLQSLVSIMLGKALLGGEFVFALFAFKFVLSHC